VNGHLGGLGNLGGGVQFYSGAFPANNKHIFEILSSIPVDWHPCWVIWLKGGGVDA